MTRFKPVAFVSLILCAGVFFAFNQQLTPVSHAQTVSNEKISITASDLFLGLIFSQDNDESTKLLSAVKASWSPRYIPLALETITYTSSDLARNELYKILEKETGVTSVSNANDWYFWLWNQKEQNAPSYSNFKADLYKNIDERFEKYFLNRQDTAKIRLDEIRWGGVHQDGIPPLRNPEMIAAKSADYLEDDNVVFGIEINGDARAYPKRILAWHEMFTDTIGGEAIAGVYCTLCGTVIPYKTKLNGVSYELGTSGFLYRSNKLMYDKATQSLWSTSRGTPVLGPLANKGIHLEHTSVVTTTWGEWKKRHPDTTVLSLDTGHRRDYGEGVAYNDYFSNDQLMFNTPFKDDRLDNKREILALRFSAAPNKQLAIDTDFLKKNPIFEEKIGNQHVIVFTDKTGANRVYDPKDVSFVEYDGGSTIKDSEGGVWTLTEEWLGSESGRKIHRLPYHRAFWFGWKAAFPETRLIK